MTLIGDVPTDVSQIRSLGLSCYLWMKVLSSQVIIATKAFGYISGHLLLVFFPSNKIQSIIGLANKSANNRSSSPHTLFVDNPTSPHPLFVHKPSSPHPFTLTNRPSSHKTLKFHHQAQGIYTPFLPHVMLKVVTYSDNYIET